jgi:signal transduction histidine kinase
LLLIANEGKSTLDNAINSVRTISHNLLPPGLETFGFVNTVSDLCNTLSNTSGISIVFTSNQPATRFNTTAELALYRIVQELLTNSLKHANAKNINITFEQKNANILLEYVDDGVGFSVETKDSKKGLGLKNMESRIMALNGILDISTKPDSGFKASLTIPLI